MEPIIWCGKQFLLLCVFIEEEKYLSCLKSLRVLWWDCELVNFLKKLKLGEWNVVISFGYGFCLLQRIWKHSIQKKNLFNLIFFSSALINWMPFVSCFLLKKKKINFETEMKETIISFSRNDFHFWETRTCLIRQ